MTMDITLVLLVIGFVALIIIFFLDGIWCRLAHRRHYHLIPKRTVWWIEEWTCKKCGRRWNRTEDLP